MRGVLARIKIGAKRWFSDGPFWYWRLEDPRRHQPVDTAHLPVGVVFCLPGDPVNAPMKTLLGEPVYFKDPRRPLTSMVTQSGRPVVLCRKEDPLWAEFGPQGLNVPAHTL